MNLVWNDSWTTKPREWLSFLKENFNPAKFQFLKEISTDNNLGHSVEIVPWASNVQIIKIVL